MSQDVNGVIDLRRVSNLLPILSRNMELECAVYGEGTVFPVKVARDAKVSALQQAIADRYKVVSNRVEVYPATLTLYLAKKDGAWLKDDDSVDKLLSGMIDTAYTKMRSSWILDEDYFGKNFQPGRKEIHVLVDLGDALVPAPTIESRLQALQQDVVWYGVRGTIGRLQGIDPNDCRTLSRTALTNDIIRRVDEMHVLLIKSPPMTGKTSLATLVSRKLANRSMTQRGSAKVFSIAALQLFEGETFLRAFHRQCGVEWDFAMSLSTQGYTIYLVVDEVQVLYKDPTSSPKRKSSDFWEVVKVVRNDAESPIRILLFGAYGSDPQYTQSMTPVDFSKDMVLGIEHLNFRREEIEEYVEKWFVGVKCLQSTIKTFCDCLQLLTGGHVGLCTVAIDVLNTVYFSRVGSGGATPSAYDWNRMLEQGSLYREKDHALFDALTSTRAVKVLKTLKLEELDGLERLVYGVENPLDAQLLDECNRKGILIGCKGRVEFSSPVMWRYFIKMRVGHVERALHGPNTLQEMIVRVVQAINYDSIRKTLGRTLSNDIPLERAWQMEFYKASYRCTPSTCVTSADVGALFGSAGFIDFTVDCGNNFWGIELLREGSKLNEHIDRFAPGGSYSLLQLSDYCLVDFRRVSSMGDTTLATITPDLHRCEKLYIVCYDPTLAHVSVLNAHFITSFNTSELR